MIEFMIFCKQNYVIFFGSKNFASFLSYNHSLTCTFAFSQKQKKQKRFYTENCARKVSIFEKMRSRTLRLLWAAEHD